MIETLYQDERGSDRRAIGKAIPASRYRRLSRALRDRTGGFMKALLPLARDDRAAPDRAPRDHRHRRILDRRTRSPRRCWRCPAPRPIFSAARWCTPKSARAALLGIGDAEMARLAAGDRGLCAARLRGACANGTARPGASAKPAPRDRAATVTAIRRATPALRSPARPSARSRCAPAAPSGFRTWRPSPNARLNCSLRSYAAT